MTEISLPYLCLLTDRKRFGAKLVEEVVRQAVDGGVGVVQLREKDLPSEQLLELANRLRSITAGKALLIVNDRVDVALASDADGVQLDEEAMPVSAVRRVAGEGLLIGRSIHGLEGALQAERDGADFLIAGTIFPSMSHPGGPTAGLELLKQLGKDIGIPFLAIGGVTVENAASVIRAGAFGVAVVGAIGGAEDPGQAARKLRETMERAWSVSAKRDMSR
ncbi:MAG: thiamine phosphate synthase [Dehalococcoidia bacterium]|nr:thiamine phosphate synthase [Dehalococcoidia bacterium]